MKRDFRPWILVGLAVICLAAASPFVNLTVDSSTGALRGTVSTNFFGSNSNALNRSVAFVTHSHSFGAISNVGNSKLLGRSTAGTGAAEEITLGTGLSLAGSTLNSSGGTGSPIGVNSGAGGAVTNFPDTSTVTWSASGGSASATAKRTGVIRELWIDAGAMVPCSTNGATPSSYKAPGTDNSTLDVIDFNDTTGQACMFKLSMPQAWNAGTVKAKLCYTQASATSGTNVLSIAAGSYGSGEVLGSILGTAVTVTNVVAATTNTLTCALTGAITVGGSPGVDDDLVFKVSRLPGDAYDTASGNLRLHGIKLQYTETTTEPTSW